MNQTTQARPDFFEIENDTVNCTLCPHRCAIRPGRFGRCGVRANDSGGLKLPYYGEISAAAVDPIEKKPLYHFLPGETAYSIGFLGCSLHCPFCQNYRISQSTRADTRTMTPEQVVQAALQSGSAAVAYTYNEPVIHIEFVLETAGLATAKGLANVLVTSGQINPVPAERLFKAMDATNIDLKSFDPQVYKKRLGGDLEAVKTAIEIAHRYCHVEVTTLVIPDDNDNDREIEAMTAFLADIDPDIVYHLSAYYPSYRYDTPPTPPATVMRLRELARQRLRYVYLGNMATDNDTRCPQCRTTWITRRGYRAEVTGVSDGACTGCGAPVPLIRRIPLDIRRAMG